MPDRDRAVSKTVPLEEDAGSVEPHTDGAGHIAQTAGGPRQVEAPRPRPAWQPATPAGPEDPSTASEAREAILNRRSRISETLDQIEVQLVAKKEALREKADVFGRLRERIRGRELPALAAAFGAGLFLALLLGGRGRSEPVGLSEEERDALLRWRKDRRRVVKQLERCASALESRAGSDDED